VPDKTDQNEATQELAKNAMNTWSVGSSHTVCEHLTDCSPHADRAAWTRTRKHNFTYPSMDLPNSSWGKFWGRCEVSLGDAIPHTWALKRTKSPGIESQPSSTKKLGFQPESFNRRPNPEIEGSWSSTKIHKASIHDPTNKSEPKHPRIEGTRRERKSNENSSKKTQKSHEL
jgi:hypothetical protein